VVATDLVVLGWIFFGVLVNGWLKLMELLLPKGIVGERELLQ
jgi:hypothetical protein